MSDSLLDTQSTLFHQIKRSLENFKKIGKNNYTPSKVRSRIGQLKEVWEECIRTHALILQKYPSEKRTTLDYFTQEQLDAHEDLYQATLDFMNETLESIEPPSNPLRLNSEAPAPIAKPALPLQHLPPIVLLPFSGEISEWESFRDRFQALIIDNEELSNFSRMHFLASSLKGRASEAIADLTITAENFEVAWKALTTRFENKRRLIETHVSALCNLPKISRESAAELQALRDKADKAISALKRLNRTPEEILDDILVFLVSQNLDPVTRRAWKLKFSENSTIPTYHDLATFLSSRASSLEELKFSNQSKLGRESKISSSTSSCTPATKCPLCSRAHFINQCQRFIEKSPSQRREIVKSLKRCLNCLSSKHTTLECSSKYTCRHCKQKHHSMLHGDSRSTFASETVSEVHDSSKSANDASQVTGHFAGKMTASPSPVLLATARVIVCSPAGRSKTVRALLDQGSEVSFLAERLAQSLRLRRIRTHTSVSAVGGVKAGICKHASKIHVTSRHGNGPTFTTTAFILPSLTKYVPRRSHFNQGLNHLAHLQFADDDPTGDVPIDLIIGADLYSSIIRDGVCKGSPGQPMAQNSHFGWVVSGPMTSNNSGSRTIQVLHCALDHQLRKFWEVEELPASHIPSIDEQQCENHFLVNYSRDANGRYIVRLPFKQGTPIDIGESRDIASRCLAALNRRLDAKPELKEEYSAFLSEYESLRHMKKIDLHSSISSTAQRVYIPHHAVFRNSSTTTRLRVVFNASSRTSNGSSLNDHLLVGPKLQTELFDVLLRWRKHQYVYTADIAKMYRQVRIDPRDCEYQRILWNADDSMSPQEYRLLTVTYGMVSAPFLALRVLKQLSDDEGKAFPLAAEILKENIYVDDVLFGAEDIPLLFQTRNQIRSLLQRGGFQLRKWASNKTECLSDIATDDHGLAGSKVLRPDESLQVLGIAWNPAVDAFQFHTSFSSQLPRTKRAILSTIAKLFDPLGWITPVTITAKIFMQQLWRLKVDWDDCIPLDTYSQWKAIYGKLSGIDGLQLPRWIQYSSDSMHYELHGFADASSAAYAAVVYCRIVSSSGQVTTSLLASKSKVAPLKPMSIPRLELSAAVLLSNLMKAIQAALKFPSSLCYCWSDSTVVLAWLNQHPSRWKPFVSHRVSAVQTNSPTAEWRHVPTDSNPADCASRGLLKTNLASYSLWWNGPDWLRLNSSEWPKTIPLSDSSALLESRPAQVHNTQVTEVWDLSSRYSDWHKLVRVTAYIMRFVNRCRGTPIDNSPIKSTALTAEECNRAKLFWYKSVQSESFSRELRALQRRESVSPRSAIVKLSPFLDKEGLIRVGGRLENSSMSFSSKHPILLGSHPIVKLIVHGAHLRSLHAGSQLTIAMLRQEYWILRIRSIVRDIIHKCVKCTREKATISQQLMGQLPRARVCAPTRAFLHCGIDYAGPILVRASSGRGIASRKAYIALFICLATRAIHLELVSSYATSAFLDAFVRFCSRRGLPEAMYSDNGTTFHGADKELVKAYRDALHDPNFLNRTASDRVSWNFIPPQAPHFGGLWEAGVRSVKYHLRRIIGNHTLTFEELTTLLCKIEACLNSRPLAPLTASEDNYDFLTPGHFLVGSALTVNPEPSLLHINENRLTRWQLVRQLTERFWKVWQTDYINTLQQRVKWHKVQPSLRIGMMVLLRNDMLPPCKWELGRITKCYAGPDGLVRVALVKTSTSEYKRPLSKLCILPIPTDSDNTEKAKGESPYN